MKTLNEAEAQEWLDYIYSDLCDRDQIRVNSDLAIRVVKTIDTLLAKDPNGVSTIFGGSRIPEGSEERSLLRALLVHFEPDQYQCYKGIEDGLDGFYVKPFMDKVRALSEVQS